MFVFKVLKRSSALSLAGPGDSGHACTINDSVWSRFSKGECDVPETFAMVKQDETVRHVTIKPKQSEQ